MEGGMEGWRIRVRPVFQYLSILSAGFQWRDLREILYVQEILKHKRSLTLSVYPGVPGAYISQILKSLHCTINDGLAIFLWQVHQNPRLSIVITV